MPTLYYSTRSFVILDSDELSAVLRLFTGKHLQLYSVQYLKYLHFQSKLFAKEFEHFLEYGIEDRLGKKIEAADRAQFEKIGKKIWTCLKRNVFYSFQSELV